MPEKIKPSQVPFWERQPGEQGWSETISGVAWQLYPQAENFLNYYFPEGQSKLRKTKAIEAVVRSLREAFSHPITTQTILSQFSEDRTVQESTISPGDDVSYSSEAREAIISSMQRVVNQKKELVEAGSKGVHVVFEIAREELDLVCQRHLTEKSSAYNPQAPINEQNYPRAWQIDLIERYDLYLFTAFTARVLEKMSAHPCFRPLGPERAKIAICNELIEPLEATLFDNVPPLTFKEKALRETQAEEALRFGIDESELDQLDRPGLRHLRANERFLRNQQVKRQPEEQPEDRFQ